MSRVFCVLLLLVGALPVFAGELSDEQAIRKLDAAWEHAFLTSDLEFFETHLHDDFVWVHNHVSSVQEGKEEILAMIRRNQKRDRGVPIEKRGSRTQREVKVIVHESTAVSRGYLKKVHSQRTVERKPDEPSHVVYYFMRTYTQQNGEWVLLSNHTQEVPEA